MTDEQARREEILAALTLKTPAEWDADPRNGIRIMSWSDFGRAAHRDGVDANTRITWEAFKRYRSGATIMLRKGRTWADADGISPRPASGEDR